VPGICGANGAAPVGSNGFEKSADMVLLAAGVRPVSELAVSAGVLGGLKNAIKVDRLMQTNVAHIYAAGDCVETWHRIVRKNTYLPLGNHVS
jgi:NADPH-dependent 2,4-dienoyl-CoA reductase/sulfur reductase-like enzyme